jgi:hypothetical protein
MPVSSILALGIERVWSGLLSYEELTGRRLTEQYPANVGVISASGIQTMESVT